MNHPTPEDLERYADGELGATEAAEVEKHLQECARCAAAALRIVMMKRAIHDVMREDAPSEELRERVRRPMVKKAARNPIWWAAAAAAALIFVTTMVMRMQSPSALPELVDIRKRDVDCQHSQASTPAPFPGRAHATAKPHVVTRCPRLRSSPFAKSLTRNICAVWGAIVPRVGSRSRKKCKPEQKSLQCGTNSGQKALKGVPRH